LVFKYFDYLNSLSTKILTNTKRRWSRLTETSRPAIAANRAAACINVGKNISAKSVHLTSLYPTALTSTNDHLTVLSHYTVSRKTSPMFLAITRESIVGFW